MMQVSIVTNENDGHVQRIESAVSLINGCQKYFRIAHKKTTFFAKSNRKKDPAALSEKVEALFPNSYNILITEDGLDDNWFSHEYRKSSVITSDDWEASYAPPSLKAYLLYQIAQALVHFAADMSEEIAMNMVHEPPIGCVYDLALKKDTIKLGMVAGNICHRCVGQLRALGTPDSAIDAVVSIISLVRSEALGKPVSFDPNEVFVVMRFTENDENDNAWKHGIKLALENSSLKATRGDARVESAQILEKINAAIRRSRLIIAKIDEKNLNVYYELGLAMGLGKDVLLVSAKENVVNLPTDLRNWECLTYDAGNYNQLRDNVARYLLEQYGLHPAVS